MDVKKYLLILVFILIISIGVVSANDDINGTEVSVSENEDASDTVSISQEVSVDDVAVSKEYSISSSNYGDYFDSDGNIVESSGISDGDTIKLSGAFNNKNFVISKNLTVLGMDDVEINNGRFSVSASGSGSTLSNLKIINNGTDLQGILLNGSSNCLISNNNISCVGASSFTIALNPGSNYNNVTDNILKTYGFSFSTSTKSTSPLVFGGANYNYIANNYVEVNDANGIYGSMYGSGSFEGGESEYNIIYNNTIRCMVLPTSWCYGIQIMGANNKAIANTVIGTYRGVSIAGVNGTVTDNKVINLTGKDYSSGAVSGGEYAIIVGNDGYIANNQVINSSCLAAAIYAGANSKIINNTVNNTGSGYGIQAGGDDVVIEGNNITTVSGAGVYEAGKISGLIVNKNTIVSTSGVGVLVKKSSISKIPSNITITNNKITTSNEYAINAQDADKDNYVITGNDVGSSKILTPDGEVVPGPDFNFNGTVYNVTPDNYHAFFDINGNLATNILDGDILNFSGVFDNVKMIVSSSIKLTGKNPVFNGVTINVTSGGVWIENLTINNLNASYIDAWGIYASDITNIMILNNTIDVYDSGAAHAVYLYSVSGAIVENNTLYSTGDYLTYTLLGYGLENSTVTGNTILTNGSGELHGYEPTKCIDGVHRVNEIFRTYGILFITSSGNNVTDNVVTVTSKLTSPNGKVNGSLSTNSLVGIDAYFDSDNNIFDGNSITINAYDNYIYGMGVIGAETQSSSSLYSDNNEFTNNNINLTAYNMATGIIAGYHSNNTEISNNVIDINAQNVGYGVTLEYAQKSDVQDNLIDIDAAGCYLIEMFNANDGVISSNNLTGNGSYVYGIGGYKASNNTISENNIVSMGDGLIPINKTNHTDALGVGNAGIIFKSNSTDNMIVDNYIVSNKDYAVNLTTASGNTVVNNYLKGENTTGNDAVSNPENNNVTDNYGEIFTNYSIANATIAYGGTVKLIANSGISGDNTTVVLFYINGAYIGNATTSNGQASMDVKLNSTYAPGSFDIQAKFTRDNYNSPIATGLLTVTKGNVVVDLKNATGKKGTAVSIEAIIKDTFGNLVSGAEVEFYRENQYIGKATTSEDGVAELVYTIPASLSADSAVIKAVFKANDYYNNGSDEAVLTFSQFAQTQIILDDIVMYYKNGTKLQGTLVDLSNNPIKNQIVTITINGVSYNRTTNSKGVFNMSINLPANVYEVTAKFAGSSDYYSAETNATVTVLGTITGNDITKIFRNGTQYYATFVDGQGNALANTNVTFNINGVFYTRTTNGSGVAKLNINLNPGTYIITAIAPNGDKIANNITVLPCIVDNSDLVKYYKNGSQYSVKVLGADGNPVGEGENVSFNINGVIYTRQTNADGVATLSINLNPSDYVITATYNGYSVANNIKVLSVIDTDDISMSSSSRVPFEAKILDAHGNAVGAGENVTFNIHGVIYHKVTDANGIAKLNINLNPGKYTITTSYNGLNAANTVTVTK